MTKPTDMGCLLVIFFKLAIVYPNTIQTVDLKTVITTSVHM